MCFARFSACIILDCHQPITFQNPVLASYSLDNSALSVPFSSVFLAKIVYILLILNLPFYIKYLLHFQSSFSIYFIQMAKLQTFRDSSHSLASSCKTFYKQNLHLVLLHYNSTLSLLKPPRKKHIQIITLPSP